MLLAEGRRVPPVPALQDIVPIRMPALNGNVSVKERVEEREDDPLQILLIGERKVLRRGGLLLL